MPPRRTLIRLLWGSKARFKAAYKVRPISGRVVEREHLHEEANVCGALRVVGLDGDRLWASYSRSQGVVMRTAMMQE